MPLPLLKANAIGTEAATPFVTINLLAGAGKTIRAVSARLLAPRLVAVGALVLLVQALLHLALLRLALQVRLAAAAASVIGMALTTPCVTTKPAAGAMKAAKAVSVLAPVIRRAVAVGLVRLPAALARPVLLALLALLARHRHLAVLAEHVTTTVLAIPFA